MTALIRALCGALLLAALPSAAHAQQADMAILTGRRAVAIPLDLDTARALASGQRAARIVLKAQNIAPGEQLILRAELLESMPAERDTSVDKWSAGAAIVAFFEPLLPGKSQTAYLLFPPWKGASPPRAAIIGIGLPDGAAPLSSLALERFELAR
jgi:hypothetical protein